MARLIAVVGKTGTGKSTSLYPYKDENIEIIGLNPKETLLINVSGKPLPTPNADKSYPVGKLSEGKNHYKTSDSFVVETLIKAVDENPAYKHIKNIVIDDAVYLQLFMFMDKLKEKGYDKFSDVGQAAYIPIKAAQECQREDLNIIFTYHFEENTSGEKKVKTAGKLVDNYLSIEGMFTFVFYSNSKFNKLLKKVEYYFETQNDGFTTAKTPLGCFKDFTIPNDMGFIIREINKYYGK